MTAAVTPRWSRPAWGLAAALFALPVIASQLTGEMQWGPGDFAVLAALLTGVCLGFEWARRTVRDRASLAASCVALLGGFLVVWINLAVGIIGAEDNPRNLVFVAVLGVGVVGALLARLRPRGMMLTLAAMALAQALAGGFALALGERPAALLSLFLVALWLLAASLFGVSAARRTNG